MLSPGLWRPARMAVPRSRAIAWWIHSAGDLRPEPSGMPRSSINEGFRRTIAGPQEGVSHEPQRRQVDLAAARPHQIDETPVKARVLADARGGLRRAID